jgi:magnesium chelatase family protein
MDRIDMHLEVPPVRYKDLHSPGDGASSVEISNRVMKAREIQTARFQSPGIHTNARMSSRQIKQFCTIDDASSALLEKAMQRFGLSARAHGRILKIARTIADLEEMPRIETAHVAEAIQYRTLDRGVAR